MQNKTKEQKVWWSSRIYLSPLKAPVTLKNLILKINKKKNHTNTQENVLESLEFFFPQLHQLIK